MLDTRLHNTHDTKIKHIGTKARSDKTCACCGKTIEKGIPHFVLTYMPASTEYRTLPLHEKCHDEAAKICEYDTDVVAKLIIKIDEIRNNKNFQLIDLIILIVEICKSDDAKLARLIRNLTTLKQNGETSIFSILADNNQTSNEDFNARKDIAALREWVTENYKSYACDWTYERSEGHTRHCFEDGETHGRSWAAYTVGCILDMKLEDPDLPEGETNPLVPMHLEPDAIIAKLHEWVNENYNPINCGLNYDHFSENYWYPDGFCTKYCISAFSDGEESATSFAAYSVGCILGMKLEDPAEPDNGENDF